MEVSALTQGGQVREGGMGHWGLIRDEDSERATGEEGEGEERKGRGREGLL